MNKRIVIPIRNTSDGVEFFLRGARKRRTMAITSVRQINTGIGVSLKLVSAKYPQMSERYVSRKRSLLLRSFLM